MNSACIYGITCRSDIPLFATPTGQGEGLELSVARATRAMPAPSEEEPLTLFQAHGRVLDILSDNPDWGPCRPNQPWRMRVQEVVSFHWSSGTEEIHYELHEQGNDELVAFWFVHIVLPLYLTIEHRFDFIHAAALEVGEGAVLFIAPSTGGKSTLGDLFLKQGHAMLSDDKVRTLVRDDVFLAMPSHPHHRPYRRFEDLGQPVAQFCDGPRPIKVFYCLEAGEPDDDISFTEVIGFEKFELLSPNYLYPLRFLQKERLRHLGSMVHATPVYRLKRPWNLERQQEIYEAVLQHVRCEIDTPDKNT